MAVKGWICTCIHTYSKQSHNHTIKYESVSLVVGEAIAYKRIFKPISPCQNNWEFADLRRSVIDVDGSRILVLSKCKQLLLRVSWWNSFWLSSWRLTWMLGKPRTEQVSLYVLSLRMIWQALGLRWIESLRLLACDTGMPYRAHIGLLKHRSNNSLIVVDQVFLRYTGAFEFLKKKMQSYRITAAE